MKCPTGDDSNEGRSYLRYLLPGGRRDAEKYKFRSFQTYEKNLLAVSWKCGISREQPAERRYNLAMETSDLGWNISVNCRSRREREEISLRSTGSSHLPWMGVGRDIPSTVRVEMWTSPRCRRHSSVNGKYFFSTTRFQVPGAN